MKAVVTGAGGMLARALIGVLERGGHEAVGLTRADADVRRPDALQHPLKLISPDWIFHLAAWTRVDECEKDPDRAFDVNALGARNVALAAASCGAGMLMLSTDYVFDGSASRPYREFDPVAPRSIYAASKWAGEQLVRELCLRHIVVRTAWLYGRGGPNFVDTVLHRARSGEALRVVDDQRGSPTWTEDLAPLLAALAAGGHVGTFHATNAGDCTWWELAAHVVHASGLEAPVEKISTAGLDRPAARPAYSVLSNHLVERVTGDRMPHWQDAVDRYLATKSTVATEP